MATPTPEPVIDAKALLDAANRASEKIAALHIAFLAVCAYVIVIVFGTTDMDLLLGKGIHLPLVAVDVPIAGFYAAVPYLLVLIHFNLLLQLQLLSRKLYAFERAAPQKEGLGGLRDQLNIFPYNYYLVGQPGRLVEFCVALLVTITILLLPLAALLTLQAFFLAYQSEAVTWAQRVAVWLDVGIVTVLWPVILDRSDSWSAFMKGVWDNFKQRPLTWVWRFAGIALAVTLLALDVPLFSLQADGLIFAFAVWLLLTISAPAWRRVFRWITRGRYFSGSQGNRLVPGATGLLVVLLLGLLLPLMFQVDGEALDSPKAVGTQILNVLQLRHLDLREGVLLAKPAQPETIADLRSTDPAKREAAERSIERIDLERRSLRGANFIGALMPLADLRGADLQGARLWQAQLRGADLSGAQLQGAELWQAQLQGAYLFRAQLQGARLWRAQLQGADLSRAQLQGAWLGEAQLQGAYLVNAQLRGAYLVNAQAQGADFVNADLQGARLWHAQLQGADLSRAQLQGARLPQAQLEGASLENASLYTNALPRTVELVDARGLKWEPLSAKEVTQLKKIVDNWSRQSQNPFLKLRQDRYLKQLDNTVAAAALKPPTLGSCLADEKAEVKCKKAYGLTEFREKLSEKLVTLACQSPDIMHGIVQRIFQAARSKDSATAGLARHLQDIREKDMNKVACPGLFALSADDATLLTGLARQENR